VFTQYCILIPLQVFSYLS